MSNTFHFPVQIYYEDTDFSGLVYHANYLKFFERAREHAIGREKLLHLWDAGIGFVVYKIELTYREGAKFGDILDIRSTFELDGSYRLNFHQEAWLPDGKKAATKGLIQLVCIDGNGRLVPIPTDSLP